jgi:hypothetical protein
MNKIKKFEKQQGQAVAVFFLIFLFMLGVVGGIETFNLHLAWAVVCIPGMAALSLCAWVINQLERQIQIQKTKKN